MISSPATARVLETVRAALAALEPRADENTWATIRISLVVLANVGARIADEARWQAEEVAAIETFAATVADTARDPVLDALITDLGALGSEPAVTRYRAASDVLCHAIAVIGAAGLDRFVPELEHLLHERVIHEAAIMGDAF